MARAAFRQSELTKLFKAAKAAGFDVEVRPGAVRLIGVDGPLRREGDEIEAELARHFRDKA